jgi:peroxiredoxin/uncharacterized membrane protein YphA (DoxX/SURF4 family)
MDVLLACRLVLAAVLLVAAFAKLADRDGSRRSLEGFGVPAPLAPAAAVALPLLELIVAIALVPVATAWVGALAGAALLLAFSAVLAVTIARGADTDCRCFGRLSSKRVGPAMLARNLLLLAIAAFVAIAGAGDAGPSATAWLGDLSTAAALGLAVGVLVGVALALNFAFLVQLLKQNGRLWAELEELRGIAAGRPSVVALGTPAPGFRLPDLAGRMVDLDDLLDGERGLLLVFSDPHCSACDPLLPEIARRQREPDAALRPLLVSLGSAEGIRAKVSDHGIDVVLLAGDDFEIAKSFGVTGMPGAVVLDAAGRVASEPALGTHRVMALLDEMFGELRLVRVEGRADG